MRTSRDYANAGNGAWLFTGVWVIWRGMQPPTKALPNGPLYMTGPKGLIHPVCDEAPPWLDKERVERVCDRVEVALRKQGSAAWSILVDLANRLRVSID